MKFIKSLIAVALLACATFAGAVETTTLATVGGSNSIFGVSGRVQSIIVANNAASAATVTFYDSPTNTFTYVNGAYTNYVSYSTNIVQVITLPSGVLQTNTNSGVFTVAQVVAASTNSYRQVATLNVAANATLVYYPTNGLLVAFGLSETNNTNVTITTTWWPSR